MAFDQTKYVFYYESDGEPSNRTHYIIAENNNEPNGGYRLDCESRKQANDLVLKLKRRIITMEDAAAEVRGKWL